MSSRPALDELDTIVRADPFGIRPGYAVKLVRTALESDRMAPDVRAELYTLRSAELLELASWSSSS